MDDDWVNGSLPTGNNLNENTKDISTSRQNLFQNCNHLRVSTFRSCWIQKEYYLLFWNMFLYCIYYLITECRVSEYDTLRVVWEKPTYSNKKTVTFHTLKLWTPCTYGCVTEGNVEWCSVSSTRHYLSVGDSGKDKRQFTPAIFVICNVDKLWDCFDSSVDGNLLIYCLFYPSHGTVTIWRTENKSSEELGGNRTVTFVLARKILFSTNSKSTVLL